MTDEQDIDQAAKLVIDQHGDSAADYALKRSEHLFDGNDAEGAAAWRLILVVIVELQRERNPGEPLN